MNNKLYFKFFDTSENDVHRYKMFPSSKRKEEFIDGMPVTFNVINKLELLKFVSNFAYPVYYNISNDEYFIDINDKRTRLFDVVEPIESKNVIEKENTMATKNNSLVRIDVEKLYKEVKERGFTMSKLCKDLGVNSGYFSNAKSRGTISNLAVVALESRFGIPRDSYVIKEESSNEVVEVVKTSDDFFSEENQRKLYKLVYTAMYNAMKRALSE